MIEYMAMHILFRLLNFPTNPMKHWFDGANSKMIDYVCEQVLKRTQSVVVGSNFFSLNIDKITIIDNKS